MLGSSVCRAAPGAAAAAMLGACPASSALPPPPPLCTHPAPVCEGQREVAWVGAERVHAVRPRGTDVVCEVAPLGVQVGRNVQREKLREAVRARSHLGLRGGSRRGGRGGGWGVHACGAHGGWSDLTPPAAADMHAGGWSDLLLPPLLSTSSTGTATQSRMPNHFMHPSNVP